MSVATQWRVAADSVAGTSHERGGLPCQDRHDCRVLDDGTLIAAVADGAGSATHAELGAELAVQAALSALATLLTKNIPGGEEQQENEAAVTVLAPDPESEPAKSDEPKPGRRGWLDRMKSVLVRRRSTPSAELDAPAQSATAIDAEQTVAAADENDSEENDSEKTQQPSDEQWKSLLLEAVSQARAAVESKAAELGQPVQELSSTLLLVVARPGLLVAGQIGDGAVVFVNGEGELMAATRPSHGEHVNETTFLISRDALEYFQFTAWHGELARLAMFSDGLERVALILPRGEPHPGFFSPLFRLLMQQDEAQMKASLRDFLQLPRLRERTDDDLTLLLAAPASALADARTTTIDG